MSFLLADNPASTSDSVHLVLTRSEAPEAEEESFDLFYSDSVELPAPIPIPLFDFHWNIALLGLPIPTPLPIPSLV